MERLYGYFKKMNYEQRITLVIRLLLVAAIVYFLTSFGSDGVARGFAQANSSDAEILFLMVLSLLLTFSFDYLEKRHNIRIPHIISTLTLIIIFCALFLGEIMDVYSAFWWWDDMLHMISSVLLGFAGLLLIYFLNSRFSMNLSPILVALFTLTFAVFIGVAWEIFEFIMDYFKGSNMQRWTAPEGIILLGKEYQGLGLRDTMSDLILNVFGGLIAGGYAFYLFKNEKRKALKMMRETFGESSSK